IRVRASILLYPVPLLIDIYILSLHVALPISKRSAPKPSSTQTRHRRWAPFPQRRSLSCPVPSRALFPACGVRERTLMKTRGRLRSEEHTSELQSRENIVCRLLLEKK